MRFAIALLLVINALLFAAQSGLVSLPEPPRPQPLPQPLRSDALQLVAATIVEYTPEGARAHNDAVAAAQSPPTATQTSPATVQTQAAARPADPVTAVLAGAAPETEAAAPAAPTAAHSPSAIAPDPMAPKKPQPPLEAVARAQQETPTLAPQPTHTPAQEPTATSAPEPPPTPTQPDPPLPGRFARETHSASSTMALQTTQPPAAKTPVLLCRQTSASAEERRILTELAQTVPGVQLTATAERGVEAWWVATPRAENEKRAQQLAETLRQKGVSDLFIVRDAGPHQWRISLGIFRTRDRAETLAAQLRQKGVTHIEILPRPSSERFTLLAKGPEAALERFLSRAKARLPHQTWEACR
ncbi:SPOR domain-containing protein [Hydrogenophilus thiooxidans]|uniref:SPOR domain-containing protein n=1 Tax=Hydrogenophilus thiooxidans TaxID=2820326 RepID=UPI001C2246BD|nr:SPOR domain-containing protein [Hydrogenophilus thiooxidans]